ncbi:DUF4269 domain-containing protein [Flavobacterium sp. S87F.05.LMB.W.Kidney.N]|uniref:DUF4269 domain-containing protein n=1 Tax=Flavobacterium sp. S87F.05.LMB.W.Kidney.N TaxID=1278758 RepID=UPI001066FD8D|nr:DUF4269 domain-containing protein [Flavobacterium sp. S87F.05.LMB.W.Kidney.N]TDX14333.1 uncharacterized protein DUF4269 [Flavobacterium sp. S87F.05.LMB.W.Kidney.N]
MIDFKDISYLKTGNPKQQAAFHILKQHKVLENLADFDPILVGTIPMNIDIENSDLDIICYWKNKSEFMKKIKNLFQNESNFAIRENLINDQESVIANFFIDAFEIEIFGQNTPTELQNGYRHMVIEDQILRSKGENFRLEIIKLKEKGIKTEPAFVLLLGLTGNVYEELLDFKI